MSTEKCTEKRLKRKKMSPYVRIFLLLGVGGAVGLVLGLIGFGANESGSAQSFFSSVGEMIQDHMVLLLTLVGITAVVLGEWCMIKLKNIKEKILTTDEEECDYWEYEEERVGQIGVNSNVICQGLTVIILSVGYSLDYIASDQSSANGVLAACILFVIVMVYLTVWTIRYVRYVQSIHPEKKGDPTTLKFQKDWLESCDEAEKEVIYKSAYKTYMMAAQVTPLMMFGAMLMNLFFNTGILAIILPALLMIILSVTYTRSCVNLRKTGYENTLL